MSLGVSILSSATVVTVEGTGTSLSRQGSPPIAPSAMSNEGEVIVY